MTHYQPPAPWPPNVVGFCIAYPAGPPLAYYSPAIFGDTPCDLVRKLIAAGWTVRAELSNGHRVTVRAIRVCDKMTGRTGRQVARTSEGWPVIDWDDGGSNSRDPDTLERVR